VIQASKGATIDSLQQLTPGAVPDRRFGDDFVNAFNVFLTYPFVDEVVGRDPQVARNLHMGDYTNLSVTLDIEHRHRHHVPTGLPTGLPTLPDQPADTFLRRCRRSSTPPWSSATC
jgi:phospholipid/cholesterol/gamma-HCH transport system substrate-binding protein